MVHKGELRSSNSGGSKKSVAIKSIRCTYVCKLQQIIDILCVGKFPENNSL